MLCESSVLALQLFAVFQLKHFAVDFILQGWPFFNDMYNKSDLDPKKWVPALFKHCFLHGIASIVLVILVTNKLMVVVGVVDFVVHFVMDRIKSSPKMLGRFKPFSGSKEQYMQFINSTNPSVDTESVILNNTLFWWSLGFDQMIHQLTYCFLVGLVLIGLGIM